VSLALFVLSLLFPSSDIPRFESVDHRRCPTRDPDPIAVPVVVFLHFHSNNFFETAVVVFLDLPPRREPSIPILMPVGPYPRGNDRLPDSDQVPAR